MDDKLMHILNDDSQNNPFCRLQLVVEILRHSPIKIQEVIKVVNKKTLL